MSERRPAQLRALCHLDRLQPQYAAFVGKVSLGDPPLEAMSSLYVETSPGNPVFALVDRVVKSTAVRPGCQIVEREYGMFEVHSHSQADVLRGQEIVLEALDLDLSARIAPAVVCDQVITNVSPHQAQLLNRVNEGTMIEAGQSLLIMEVEPAAYVCLAANEAEKAAPVLLNGLTSIGVYGRLWMSGSESDVTAARHSAHLAMEQLEGR